MVYGTHPNTGMPEPGGQGGLLAAQYLVGQLTLLQLGGADSAQPLLLEPPNLFTFRHHCNVYIRAFNSDSKRTHNR